MKHFWRCINTKALSTRPRQIFGQKREIIDKLSLFSWWHCPFKHVFSSSTVKTVWLRGDSNFMGIWPKNSCDSLGVSANDDYAHFHAPCVGIYNYYTWKWLNPGNVSCFTVKNHLGITKKPKNTHQLLKFAPKSSHLATNMKLPATVAKLYFRYQPLITPHAKL